VIRTKKKKKIFISYPSVQKDSESHVASYVMGTGVLYTRLKRARHERDRSPNVIAKVKKELSYTSTLSCALMSCRVFCYVILSGNWLFGKKQTFPLSDSSESNITIFITFCEISST
jgi:hypothetical protein